MIHSPRITSAATPATARTGSIAARPNDLTTPGRPVAGGSRTVDALAAEPPVDTDRVTTIRTAIANGTYPINPTEIADALIAARWLLIDGGRA